MTDVFTFHLVQLPLSAPAVSTDRLQPRMAAIEVDTAARDPPELTRRQIQRREIHNGVRPPRAA